MANELEVDPLVVENAMQVRMHVGHLMMEGRDFEGATRYFRQIYDEDRNHDFVPTALLRMAEAFYELGDYKNAEHWTRELRKDYPILPEAASATVLLGRVLLALERYESCRQVMESSFLRLQDAPEIIDLYLILAMAEMKLGMTREVLDHTEILNGAHSFRELNYRQFLDFTFLYGYGLLGEGRHKAAMEVLELFLIRGENDPRRGEVFVMLGEAYLALDKFLEARAAALEARESMGSMDEASRNEARKLYAKTSLAVGDKEGAFREMESQVRRTFDQGLILFLIDEFMKEGRFQRAITTAELLVELDTPEGDQARYRKVLAMWRQAQQSKMFDDVPAKAVEVAKQIQDEELQSKVAEIIGQAYEAVGDLQRATEAYRGILR